jgi:asparagine synthase (glutamine-hydrolysing)
MCGIAAIAGKKIDRNRYSTEAMLQKLKHRGPDGQGEASFPDCWLGHRRLAIVDLKLGDQPMVDDKLTITFNGEIYNHRELRNQLEKLGYNFKTQSDTETILKAYRMWGKNCPKHLDGMFSFAIWDDKEKELFISRDRLGKKPLYYFFDGGTILIASEIKALIASGALVPDIDYKAIDNYLRIMYIPPWKSVYKNVHQVPPAHCGVFKDGKLSLNRYWTLARQEISISYGDAKEEVRRLFYVAVKKRIDSSDVELGSFLSGGLDSSLVTIFAAKELSQPLKVFSVSYDNHNELPFAKRLCEKIKGKHFITHVNKCMTQELDKIISYFDEPHADTSDFPQHLVSQLAAQKVKVVLSGDGADELFLGYKWHLQQKNSNLKLDSPDLFHNRLHSICAFPSSERSLLWNDPDMVNDDILAKYAFKDEFIPIDNVTVFDLTSHLPGQILTKVDRAGMMHGLEVRSPFLDTALIEFVFNLPYAYKVRNGEQKYILKDILIEYMPHDFVYRRKQGFGAPIEKWLSDPTMKEYTQNKLGYEAKIRSILSPKSIDNYLNDFYINKNKHERAAQRLWVLLCLERWMTQLNLSS